MDTTAAQRPARLTAGVIGVGRVGAVLGAALAAAGHHVVAASAVSDASRTRADALLPGVAILTPPEVLARADLVLLTVPDDELAELTRGLVATDAVRPGQLLAHTSGRFGVGVLDAATRAGALPLALHPVMTFTGTSVDLARLAGCSFGVTAPEPLRPVAEALVVEMGGEPQWVAEDQRALYHAALANAANHLVTLVASSSDLLRRCAVEHPEHLLGPLLGAALDNALRSGDAALTGPVVRGDAGTVAAHLAELATVSAEAYDAYVAMARLTADRALAAGLLSAPRAEALLDVLAGPTTRPRRPGRPPGPPEGSTDGPPEGPADGPPDGAHR
jgi:predicted short-subunit dehydrogenase-like oxidoreductase (DUF2520 family)